MKKYILSAALFAMTGVAFAQPCNDIVIASYNDPVCYGKDLNITATFFPGATYSWEGPGGFLSFVRNTTISNTTTQSAGEYIITVNIGMCEYKDTVNVDIHALPVQPVVSTVGPACFGDSLWLQAVSTAGADTFLFWDPMGNPFTVAGNLSPANNGVYTCVAVSEFGCVSDTGKLNVTVQPTPATPTLSLLKAACSGDTLKLAAYAPGGISSFKFFDPNGNQVSSSIGGISYLNTGIYKCVAIGTSGCASDSGSLSVMVKPTIIPGVAIYGDVEEAGPFGALHFTSLVSKAGYDPKYQWLRNGNPILNANGPFYNATSSVNVMPGDVISLRVTSDDTTCPGTAFSNNLTVTINLDVNDIDKAGGFAIYPNPSNGIVHVKTNYAGTYKVDILNAMGSVVYTAQGNGDMHIDVTDKIPAGNYIIRMTGNNQSVSRKLNIIQ